MGPPDCLVMHITKPFTHLMLLPESKHYYLLVYIQISVSIVKIVYGWQYQPLLISMENGGLFCTANRDMKNYIMNW